MLLRSFIIRCDVEFQLEFEFPRFNRKLFDMKCIININCGENFDINDG